MNPYFCLTAIYEICSGLDLVRHFHCGRSTEAGFRDLF